ncbi:MAG TPA: TetR family transcriptional regulator [Pseudonocardiaceae bacterium]|jgi:AcrR family transcriptional regulator|nr:TetR family transcriptional regulator [Pseudonocardiaceae bacterium]
MAIRDPEAKRQQLLAAGLSEFAAYGIAGARIDRIAKLAGCSAGLVYSYFGSKDELFEAVFEDIIARTLAEIPITPDDLPGYAGRLFDSYERHPEMIRMITWYQLERAGTGAAIPAVLAATRAKTEAIRGAQHAGTVSTRFDAEQVLAMVLNMSVMWLTQLPEAVSTDYRRTTIVEGVRRLVEP